LDFSVAEQVWPLHQPFRISRGSRTEARVVVVTVTDGHFSGRGEAVPSRRYGQSSASVIGQLESVFANANRGFNSENVQKLLSPGAARNALDCALWDLEAKRSGKRAWELANIPVIDQITTAFTISLDTPVKMAADVKTHSGAPILKLKLGGDNLDVRRVEAVRAEAADARLLIDANEAWSPQHYEKVVPELTRLGVALIEQPFPARNDEVLASLDHPIPVCADESCRTTADLPRLQNLYEAVNVKLDKTGGLTEALYLTESARNTGFNILFGCMVCTSLGIAPARLLTRENDYVDLDGPLLLARDREHGLQYQNGKVSLPSRELWG
jgi:L-alanine-DL-glutamate epimerase-like enolase superfamily enzyme